MHETDSNHTVITQAESCRHHAVAIEMAPSDTVIALLLYCLNKFFAAPTFDCEADHRDTNRLVGSRASIYRDVLSVIKPLHNEFLHVLFMVRDRFLNGLLKILCHLRNAGRKFIIRSRQAELRLEVVTLRVTLFEIMAQGADGSLCPLGGVQHRQVRPIDFVPAEGIEVHPERLDVYGAVGGICYAIDAEQRLRAHLAHDLGDGGDIVNRAKDVGRVRTSNEFRARSEEWLEVMLR